MKKNLILLHGALGSAARFNELIPLLETHFNVITFHFEGHGGRPANGPYSIARFTENVLEAMAARSLEKAAIFGYSMGGYVALNLALHHPGKVEKIITLGTKFNWTKETADRETRMLQPEKMKEKIPAFVAHLKAAHQPLPWKEVVTKTAGMMRDLGNGACLKTKDLQNIPHPVLISIGEQDTMVTLEESEAAALALPHGALHIFGGFPHPLEKTDHQALADLIIKFISKSP